MRKRTSLIILLLIITGGMLLPESFHSPVQGMNKKSYHPQSYWYSPWGKSGVHKGVDIFAKKGTSVHSSTSGIVLYRGELERGGNVVLVLGPRWRIHYYAHLDQVSTGFLSLINSKSSIGTVGNTGNAKNKPPHLHYSIITLVPYVWRIDGSIQGWKKMFYLNPIDFLKQSS